MQNALLKMQKWIATSFMTKNMFLWASVGTTGIGSKRSGHDGDRKSSGLRPQKSVKFAAFGGKFHLQFVLAFRLSGGRAGGYTGYTWVYRVYRVYLVFLVYPVYREIPELPGIPGDSRTPRHTGRFPNSRYTGRFPNSRYTRGCGIAPIGLVTLSIKS